MQVSVLPDGRIDTSFRPPMDDEQYDRFTLYDPHSRGINYNLYDRVQKPCDTWKDHYHRRTQTGVRDHMQGHDNGTIGPAATYYHSSGRYVNKVEEHLCRFPMN